ncbi:MAG: phosphatase PAP2 family protein [Methylococcales bacterium]|nr:phosphatase PAP2 family protein [Methylococcales bacterium]
MNLFKLDRKGWELSCLIVLILITTPIFWLTDLDQQVSSLFYRSSESDSSWPWKDWWLWRYLFDYADAFIRIISIGLLFAFGLSHILPKLKTARRALAYLLLVILIGPGLIVNLVFKDHWGRARPVHITEFGGQFNYTPPLKIGHTPDKSFPCGHCSVGFMFFALYFLSRKHKRYYLAITLAVSFALALARLSAGGHFLSDILWSGYLVFFVSWLLYYGWYLKPENLKTFKTKLQ